MPWPEVELRLLVVSMDGCMEISSEVGIEYWLGSEEPLTNPSFHVPGTRP